jgi:hypothetical protein
MFSKTLNQTLMKIHPRIKKFVTRKTKIEEKIFDFCLPCKHVLINFDEETIHQGQKEG